MQGEPPLLHPLPSSSSLLPSSLPLAPVREAPRPGLQPLEVQGHRLSSEWPQAERADWGKGPWFKAWRSAG